MSVGYEELQEVITNMFGKTFGPAGENAWDSSNGLLRDWAHDLVLRPLRNSDRGLVEDQLRKCLRELSKESEEVPR